MTAVNDCETHCSGIADKAASEIGFSKNDSVMIVRKLEEVCFERANPFGRDSSSLFMAGETSETLEWIRRHLSQEGWEKKC